MRKKFKNYLIISYLCIFALSGCGTLKEGFSSQKKNSVDEFLVEKKLPLVMPPDFNKLPVPKNNIENQEDEFESLKSKLSKDQEKNSFSIDTNNSSESSFEQLIIKKIKDN